MARLIVLFNLKPGQDAGAYERWAREVDLPTVRGFESVDGFDVNRATGLLMGEGDPPYQYIEVIDVNDMDGFAADVSTDAMKAIAAQFQEMTDNPVFILSDPLD